LFSLLVASLVNYRCAKKLAKGGKHPTYGSYIERNRACLPKLRKTARAVGIATGLLSLSELCVVSIFFTAPGINIKIFLETSYRITDDFGYNIAEEAVHAHDLQATLLHLLDSDHGRLVYKHQGRRFRLTDVHGTLVTEILG